MKQSPKNYKLNFSIVSFSGKMVMTLGVFSLLLVSCKKEDTAPSSNSDNNNNQGANPPTVTMFSAKIDGTEWTTDAAKVSATFMAITNSIILTAEKNDGSIFTLQINLWDKTTGSFKTSLSSQKNILGLTYKDAKGDSWTAPARINDDASNVSSGTLNVDYFDGTKIKCSFSFTGGSQQTANTHEIKEGEISVMTIKN
ncbi:MAG: hypothetical protein H6605_03995 [Flavobacteriales bacterium]|nr:hypothetical protein [Flavobacteriales bacterium]